MKHTHPRLAPACEVSPLGLGCMGMSQSFGPRPPRDEMITFLRAAVDRGVTLFDTAEVYGPVPQRGARRRGPRSRSASDVVIATKFGFAFDEDGNQTGVSSRPEHIRAAVDGSLRRLRTDAIDLLYQHRVDPDVPIEDVAGTVKELIEAGKVHHFGTVRGRRRTPSAAPTPCSRSRPCRASTPCSGASPRTRSCPPCDELGIGFVPVQPARPRLPHRPGHRRHRVRRGRHPRAPCRASSARRSTANLALVDLVTDGRRAQGRHRRPGRARLAARPEAAGSSPSPAPGASNGSTRTSARPTSSSPPRTSPSSTSAPTSVQVQGDRYPEAMQKMIDR